MATIAAIAVLGAGIWSSSSSSKATSKNLKGQQREIDRLREQNRYIAEDTYTREKAILDGLPSLTSLLEEGGTIADSQRENLLDFVMGDSQKDLREAQRQQAALASYDFNELNKNISNVLRSSQFDLVAMSGGDPIGSLANFSARNIAQFAQQGLANSLNLGDYFARTGQVDRFNPYNIAVDLYKVKEGQVNARIGIEEGRANRLISGNNNYQAAFSDIENARMANKANEYAGYSQAVSNAVAAYTGVSGMQTDKKTSDTKNSYYSSLTAMLNKQNAQQS